MPESVYIVSAARTPIGGFGGSLQSFPATKLGSIAIKAALERANLKPEAVDEVFFGNVLSAGNGQNPARQAAIFADLPKSVPCTTLNKVCASGMKAISLAAQSIVAGDNHIVVAGGMESMSNAPYLLPKHRWGSKYGHQEIVDCIVKDGLFDVYNEFLMGNAAELCAKEHEISREMQDEYAISSYERAQAATAGGLFESEIIPIEVPVRGKPSIIVKTDEEVANLNKDKLKSVKAVFQTNGTVTAANASTLSDGAAALIVCSGSALQKYNLKPLCQVVSWADAALEPERFTVAPSIAVPRVLSKANLTTDQVDLFELNEAFSVVAVANAKILKLDASKVNVNGGAVSMGHPLGCSGARIIVTLINALKQQNKTIGCGAICNGGGGASALVIKLLK